jgi:hypothetical protein
MRLGNPIAALAVAAISLGLAACGLSSAPPTGLQIAGAGLQTGAPPWHPEYAHLTERVHEMQLPPVGAEKFHIHAMLHIYNEGLLVPVPAEIGLEPTKHIETSMHTHDGTGIIHMEAAHPFAFTLGDFFKVWGVKLGPAQVGGLTGAGANKLHFYLNGKPLTNPAAQVLHNGDSIVIGYGPANSFTHTPSIRPLKELEEGKGGFGCSAKPGAKTHGGCLQTTTTTTSTSTTGATAPPPKG